MGSLDGKKILVVDDSATMRMLVGMILKRTLGVVSVTEAVDGMDAIRKFQTREFDIVILDIQMPGMDGVQFVDTVRRSFGSGVPIVMLTTKGDQQDIDSALAAGANGYITKPVNSLLLKQTIENLFAECEV